MPLAVTFASESCATVSFLSVDCGLNEDARKPVTSSSSDAMSVAFAFAFDSALSAVLFAVDAVDEAVFAFDSALSAVLFAVDAVDEAVLAADDAEAATSAFFFICVSIFVIAELYAPVKSGASASAYVGKA
jgi:hypothetical protein